MIKSKSRIRNIDTRFLKHYHHEYLKTQLWINDSFHLVTKSDLFSVVMDFFLVAVKFIPTVLQANMHFDLWAA